MVENGKAITNEPEEEEDDWQALIAQIEAKDEEEENVSQVPSVVMLPPYISPWKGIAKIPKDLESSNNML